MATLLEFLLAFPRERRGVVTPALQARSRGAALIRIKDITMKAE
jgi:hypothetical protein